MGSPTLQRPLKTGNVRTYVEEVGALAPNDAPILAPEVDADIDLLVNAWNNAASTFPPTDGSVTTSKLADGTVTRAKIAADAWLSPVPVAGDVGKVLAVATGPALAYVTPPGGPPTGAAGGDLAGSTYPAPVVIPVARSKWLATGNVLTPVGATSPRITPAPSCWFEVNNLWGAQVEPAKASWGFNVNADADQFAINRRAPGAVEGGVPVLNINTFGNVSLKNHADDGRLTVPSGSGKGSVICGAANGPVWTTRLMAPGVLSANSYFDGGWQRDDPSKSGWRLALDAQTDQMVVTRIAPAGTPALDMLKLDASGQLQVGADTTFRVFKLAPSLNLETATSHIGLTYNGSTAANFNAAYPTLLLKMDTATPFQFWRAAPGGALALLGQFDVGGSLVIAGPTGQKSTGTTWSNPSDRRMKEQIADYPTGLATVAALKPRTFVYNGKGGSAVGTRGYGFVADEVAAVMPEMVGTYQFMREGADDTGTEYATVDQSNLILALVNAVQELATRVAALEGAPA